MVTQRDSEFVRGVPGPRVRELLARCQATSDHAERAALLTWVADELDATARTAADSETIGALRSHADRARGQAQRERAALARAAAGGTDRPDREPNNPAP